MAEFIGKDGIHNISGTCELCGTPCDPGAEELNCLSCTFQQCEAGVYHQDCLEKFLKRIGCEKCAACLTCVESISVDLRVVRAAGLPVCRHAMADAALLLQEPQDRISVPKRAR